MKKGCDRCRGRELKPIRKKWSELDRMALYLEALERIKNPTRMCIHCHDIIPNGLCPKHGAIC